MTARTWEIVSTLTRHWGRAGWNGLGRWSLRRRELARHTRLAFEELGPAFIKLGQLISVRPDLFGPELVLEMSTLRDSVAPIPFSDVCRVIEAEFGRSQTRLFDSLDPRPLASASIAQVHVARLKEAAKPPWGPALPAGTAVVVKVVKPEVEHRIVDDFELAARWLDRLGRRASFRVDWADLLNEFRASLRRELDMRLEGRVADRFAFDFRDDHRILVPRVVWTRTTRRVLTMEHVAGWDLSRLEAARAAGVDTRALAVHGARAFMQQVLVHGRYHADLHPANLLVTEDGRIGYLDFGIVGFTTPEERGHIAQVLAGLVYRDPDRVLHHADRLGLSIPDGRLGAVADEVSTLIDETLDAPSDMRRFGVGLLSILRRHQVAIPIGFGMLVKALITVEGVARALYPDIDLVVVAEPVVTRMLLDDLLDRRQLARRAPTAMATALRELAAP